MSSPPAEPAKDKKSKKSCRKMSKCQTITLSINVTLIVLLLAMAIYVIYLHISGIVSGNDCMDKDRDNTVSLLFDCAHRELRFAIRPHGDYWLLENYVIGSEVRRMGCGAAVTLVTYGSGLSPFDALPELVRSWQAPVSIAIFAPGTDFAPTLAAIHNVRECSSEASLIRSFVTFHIFFPYEHTPHSVPSTEQEVLSQRVKCNFKFPAYMERENYAYSHKLNYSASLAKNIATEAANTLFVLVSDVNFVPSEGVSEAFFTKLEEKLCPDKETCQKGSIPQNYNAIFTIPTISLNSGIQKPKNSKELEALLRSGSASKFKPKMPQFVASKFIPPHDERIQWTPTVWQTRPQLYAICLLAFEIVPLQEAFFYVYSNSPTYGLLVNKTLSASQAAAMTTIGQEYPFLYGDDAKRDCAVLL